MNYKNSNFSLQFKMNEMRNRENNSRNNERAENEEKKEHLLGCSTKLHRAEEKEKNTITTNKRKAFRKNIFATFFPTKCTRHESNSVENKLMTMREKNAHKICTPFDSSRYIL